MLTKEKRWLGALLALCMAAGLIPAAAAEAEPVSGTVARGVYLDAAGNSQSYEVAFDTPLPSDGCELATGSYYLTEDLDLTTDFTVADNAVVKLDLAGHILRGTGKVAVITVGDNACLEVYDSDANEDNPTPTTHYYTEDENSVWVFDDANPSGTPWTGGVITGGGRAEGLSSSIRSRGGLFARYTNYDPATSRIAISLFGGSVCGNRQDEPQQSGDSYLPGTGIVADNAKVLVAGGSICGNQKGRCVESPCFTMTGGLLQGDSIARSPHFTPSVEIDQARVTVDGVTKNYPGTMVMYGGTIRNALIRIGGSIPVRPCRFTMYGGEITGTVDSGDHYTDYLVRLLDSTFEMYGGSIHDAEADHMILMSSNVIPENSTPGEEGGCTFLLDGGTITHNTSRYELVSADAKGTILIRSGKITDNASQNRFGGTIGLTGTISEGELVGAGTCVIEGGEISGNQNPGVQALNESCGLSLSGAARFTGNSGSDIDLRNGCKITIAGPLSSTEKVTVDTYPIGVFTSGWSAQMGDADPADYFTSARTGFEVALLDGEAALVEVPIPVTEAKGSYMDAKGNTKSYDVTFDLPLSAEGGDISGWEYYLPEDLELTTDLTVMDHSVARLDLAGHILRGTGKGAVITVGKYSRLEIYDSSANADNATPTTHYYTEAENGVWIFDDTDTSGVPWTGGVITTGNAGPAITLIGSDDPAAATSVELFNGSICGNSDALSCNDGYGRLLMAGGTIGGNSNGLQVPALVMTGGMVFDNQDCGVKVIGSSTVSNGTTQDTIIPSFLMRGGKIKDNVGSGIFVDGSVAELGSSVVATMYGGAISGNSAADGGGIYLSGRAKFDMRGGQIVNNMAQDRGGGIYTTADSTLQLGGDITISGNSSESGTPSNVYLGAGSKICFAPEYPLTCQEKVGVCLETPWEFTPWVFTSGWSGAMGTAEPADYFVSEMEGHMVETYTPPDDPDTHDGVLVETPIIPPIVTHTATFVVGDEVIDRVVFAEGAATLAEPALPQRANYVGRWESYDLAAATGDITVHGLYTPLDPDAVSDVDAGVTATYDKSEVTIDLFARADSRTVKVVSQQTKPVDVVLVLDQSGSMKDSLSARDRQSKRDALVNCANAFVQSLYENAVASGADHRVAVVGFAYSSYNGGNYKNTGLLATPSGQSVNYARLKESDYRSALLPVNDGGHINANVVSGINAIRADGATAADLGLKMARDIFSANPTQGERERIVIFITDGTPTSWGEEPARVRPTAATAISVASTIKNAQGAKIYSVGVHANADPSAAFTKAPDGITTNRNGTFVSYDFNRFLHAVSSNYPSAAAMDALGDGDKNGGFYMGVRDTENLDKIFTNILYSTVYQLKAFDKATLYYTLTPAFTLTTEQELAMRQALATQGLTEADIQVIRNADSTTSLRFQNVKVREVYGEDGKLHYEAAVRFQVSANQTDAVLDPSLASWTISEATLSPAHTHSFAPVYQTGSCREGLTSVYRCACGETRSETTQPAEHDFVAVLADNGGVGAEVERVVCTKCGHSEEQHINFKVSYSSARKTTVLDLNLLQNDVDVVQPTEDIELRFFVGEDGGKLYTVTRIDPDGQRTTYQTRAEGGYLVFRVDHFSIYVLSELDETTAQPVEAVSYEQAVELLDSKTVSAPTAPLEGAGTGGGTGIGGIQIANDTLSAMIDLADGLDGAAAFLAVYTQGRMTGVQRTALAPGRQSVSFSIPEGADRVKLFVLSGDSAPLCGAYQLEP